MRTQYFPLAIVLCGILTVSAWPVQADVVQCIEGNGTVTYTNLPCETGTAPVSESNTHSPDQIDSPAPESAWLKNHGSNRSVTVDTETLKAARDSLQIHDQASPKQTANLVALDQRNPGWFDFH
ncbi:MAG TPA: hypothetical protein VK832_08735 [Burkholderiaceae bacterium]|jgi:hypothetical protein|nr:hypothetical protein [Burkholderiaceae bacterium]